MGNRLASEPNTSQDVNVVERSQPVGVHLNILGQNNNQSDPPNQSLNILSNEFILHKDSLSLKPLEENSKTYTLTFRYSASSNVNITVYIQPTIEKEFITGKIQQFHLKSATPAPKQYKCPAGFNMPFPEKIIQIDPEIYGGVDEFTAHTESKYPLVIILEPVNDVVSEANQMRNIYLYTFVLSPKNELSKLQLLKQRLEVKGESYEIDDIYIASADNTNTQMLSVGPVTCIVCYTENAKVLLYPCKHFCLCKTCATKIKEESKGCPVCRVGVERFFDVQL